MTGQLEERAEQIRSRSHLIQVEREKTQMELSHKRARVELERAASASARSYEVGSGGPAPEQGVGGVRVPAGPRGARAQPAAQGLSSRCPGPAFLGRLRKGVGPQVCPVSPRRAARRDGCPAASARGGAGGHSSPLAAWLPSLL